MTTQTLTFESVDAVVDCNDYFGFEVVAAHAIKEFDYDVPTEWTRLRLFKLFEAAGYNVNRLDEDGYPAYDVEYDYEYAYLMTVQKGIPTARIKLNEQEYFRYAGNGQFEKV